jgi:pimeloyl-ACP methyl ester carboxylesterase
MNPLAMVPLQLRVRKLGFNVTRFGYRSMRSGLEVNAARLSRFIEAIEADVVHLVAHSLGGLVTMRALQLRPDTRAQRIVLLGSPVAGSSSGRRLADFRAGRLLLGNSDHIWKTPPDATFPEDAAVGVIAGSMPIGLGRLVGRLPRPNDGVVTVAETQVRNATDKIVLPVTHTALLFSAGVARQVCFFLRDSRFAHVAST